MSSKRNDDNKSMKFKDKIKRGDVATVAQMLGKSKALVSRVLSGDRTDVDGKVRKSFELLFQKREELSHEINQINNEHA